MVAIYSGPQCPPHPPPDNAYLVRCTPVGDRDPPPHPENRMPGNWCDNRNFPSNRTGAEWVKGCCVFDRQYTAAIETCIYRLRRKGTSATTPLGLSTNNHVLPKLLPFAFSWISKRKSRNTACTPPLLGRFLQEDIEIRKKSPNFIFYRDFGWFGSIVRLNRVLLFSECSGLLGKGYLVSISRTMPIFYKGVVRTPGGVVISGHEIYIYAYRRFIRKKGLI